MLIPPSLSADHFRTLAEQSIGDLFIAGIVPGLLLGAAFCVMILLYAYLAPDKVQDGGRRSEPKRQRKTTYHAQALVSMLPLVALVAAGDGRHLCRLVHANRVGRHRRPRRAAAGAWRAAA